MTVLYDCTAGVAVITLNRPEVMNALNSQMRLDLRAAIARAEGEAWTTGWRGMKATARRRAGRRIGLSACGEGYGDEALLVLTLYQ